MKQVGRKQDEQAGRRLMRSLEAATLAKRQPWYLEALDTFVSQGLISPEQAAELQPYIGQPITDSTHLGTPYDKALNAGVITQSQAAVMNRCIFQRAHSATALCSGTSAHHFTQGKTTLSNVTLSAIKQDENAVKVSGGAELSLQNVTVEKRGDTSDHSEGSFTGLNAAVLAEGGTICLLDSAVISHAIGGNNVFAHGKGSYIRLKNVLLDAYGTASNRCVYVSFGGEVEAEDCEFVSRGAISSTVATDTGGGTIRLKNCLVKTLGGHCASLYSTGRIAAEHCVCAAPETEALIIVGGNSMTLTDTCVFSGQGQGIKLAAAMEKAPGSFTMTGGSLTACEGPVLLAESGAEVTLRRVSIANPSGEAVQGVQSFAPPGMEQAQAEPALLHLTLREQTLSGNISADKGHTLHIEVLEGSRLTGAINRGGVSPTLLHLSADSCWELTGDSVIDTLSNEDPSGGNILTNGYCLKILSETP